MALENLIRLDQLRTALSNGGDNTDVDQLTGAALLIKLNNSAVISDFTVAGAATGAALVAMQGISGFTNVQTSLVRTHEGAQCVGTADSLANLETAFPAATNVGRTAFIIGAGMTVDGVYRATETSPAVFSWEFQGALIGRSGAGPYVFNFGNKELTGLGAPLTSSSAATRQFVESLVQGLAWNFPVNYKADIVVDVLATLGAATPYVAGTLGFANDDALAQGVLYRVTPTIAAPVADGGNVGVDVPASAGTYTGFAGSFRVRVTTAGAYGAAVVTVWFTKTGGSEVLVGTRTPASGVAFNLDSGATLSLTEDAADGLLLNDQWTVAITSAWVAVVPTVGERLMLNGSATLPSTLNLDWILTYSTAFKWDADNTGTTRHTPVARETRIYTLDNIAYTYVDTETKWVISDASGGQIGTRTYTYQYNVVNLETLTDSIDKLDIAVGNRAYSITGGLGTGILTTAESVAASLQKINQLGNIGNNAAYGTFLIGHYDTSSYYTSDYLHGILEEIGLKLAGQAVKGSHFWRKNAGIDAALNVGHLSFATNTKLIYITEAYHWSGLSAFLGNPGTNLDYNGGANTYGATRLALAAGFKFETVVNGQHWMPTRIEWDDTTKILTITVDDNLKNTDLVDVTMTRNGKT